MDKIILKDFRCFHASHEVPLAPLTFLIGENSTGKSSFLAAISKAWDMIFENEPPDFNKEPFELGSYDQIANYRGGKAGRAKEFSLGLVINIKNQEYSFVGSFEKAGASPRIVSLKIDFIPYSISMEQKGDKNNINSQKIEKKQELKVILSTPSGNIEVESLPLRSISWFSIKDLLFYVDRGLRFPEVKETKIRETVFDMIRFIRFKELNKPIIMAPIRTNPQRTYDPKTEWPKPTGEHIPNVLSRIKATNPELWKGLVSQLNDFGLRSGLYKKIDIHEHGKPLVDPFQVRVTISGPSSNLIDVGYGVSQVLPILVESVVSAKKQSVLLLQQPEVHLHPRAQAELGTFFGKLVKQKGLKFIIETHSDYILDRVRLDIRDRIKDYVDYKDVLILYFQRKGSEIEINQIKIDENGNIVNPPKNFRKFFLAEEKRYFGIKDVHDN